jgi:hypothetical protein
MAALFCRAMGASDLVHSGIVDSALLNDNVLIRGTIFDDHGDARARVLFKPALYGPSFYDFDNEACAVEWAQCIADHAFSGAIIFEIT